MSNLQTQLEQSRLREAELLGALKEMQDKVLDLEKVSLTGTYFIVCEREREQSVTVKDYFSFDSHSCRRQTAGFSVRHHKEEMEVLENNCSVVLMMV